METIHIDINVAEIIDDAGIETEAHVLIDLEFELPINIIGRHIPAKLWGDDAHPAEYPDAECQSDPVDLSADLLTRSGLTLPDDERERFLDAAYARFEIEIDKACTEALA